MTLSPKPKRPLTLTDLASISQDTSDEKMIQEITRIRKSISEEKKEKERLKRQIESLQNNISCAENAREIANANAIKIAKKLCELFGEKLNQEQIYLKISDLQKRAADAKREVEELQIQIAYNKQIMKDNYAANQTLNNTLKSQINDTQVRASKLGKKTKLRVDDIESVKTEIQKEKEQFNDIIQRIQEITHSSNFDPKALYNTILNQTETGILKKANQLFSDKASIHRSYSSIPQFCQQTAKEIKNMKSRICSDEMPNLFRDKIMERKEEINKLDKQIAELRESETALRNQLYNKVADITPRELLEREQNNRTKKMRMALKKACQIAGFDYSIPHKHSDLCQMYVNVASRLRETVQQSKKENDQLISNQARLDQKIAFVEIQNEDISHLLKRRRH